MVAKPVRNIASEIAFLTRALKTPSLAGAVERLAERARTESWSHEEFLAACLQREVAARESHGGEGRIRAARFPARKSLEGLGIRACQAGHRAAFATAAQWVARLAEAHHAGRLQEELVKLGRIPLLIIDEVGYIPFEAEAATPPSRPTADNQQPAPGGPFSDAARGSRFRRR